MYLFIIVFFSAVIRLWQLSAYPPMVNGYSLDLRLYSTIFSLFSGLIIYLYIYLLNKNKKIALLTALLFYLLPWNLEQSRIASLVNQGVFIFLLLLYISEKIITKRTKKIVIQTLILLIIFFAGQVPLGYKFSYPIPWNNYLGNIFSISSFSFLFFNNNSYWFGGIREYGVLFLSFLPFFVLGIYDLFIKKNWQIVFWLILIVLLTAGNYSFPEGRGFYLATPFLSYIISLGLYRFSRRQYILNKLLIVIFIFIFSYEMSNFWHFYLTHYSAEIISTKSQIHGKF